MAKRTTANTDADKVEVTQPTSDIEADKGEASPATEGAELTPQAGQESTSPAVQDAPVQNVATTGEAEGKVVTTEQAAQEPEPTQALHNVSSGSQVGTDPGPRPEAPAMSDKLDVDRGTGKQVSVRYLGRYNTCTLDGRFIPSGAKVKLPDDRWLRVNINAGLFKREE